MSYFIGVILPKKCCQKQRVQKIEKKGDSHTGGFSIEGGVQVSCTLWNQVEQKKYPRSQPYNLTCDYDTIVSQ